MTGTATTQIIKAAPGNLYDAYLTNNTGSTLFLFVFNSKTAPTNGSVTAGTAAGNYQDCVVVPTGTSVSVLASGSPGEPFNSGVTLASSSTGCGTLTLSAPTFMKGRAK